MEQPIVVKTVVACYNASGEPDFFFVLVELSRDYFLEGRHYQAAGEQAENEGYEGPFVMYDEYDPPGDSFIGLFEWASASTIKVPPDPL